MSRTLGDDYEKSELLILEININGCSQFSTIVVKCLAGFGERSGGRIESKKPEEKQAESISTFFASASAKENYAKREQMSQ